MSFSHTRDVLPSGLRVVTVATPHLHSALLTVFVRAGSRHETPQTNGIGHMLEHLFFRGSEHFPDPVAMNAAIEEVGGNLNGVTMRDHGFYETAVAPEGVGIGLRILGDMLTRPRLSHLDVERSIILEELLDEVDEDGRDIDLDNLSKMALFGDHPMGMKIAGTPETVRAFTDAQIREHLRRHYVSGNLVVCAAGRVKRDEVLALVADAFSALPEGPTNTEVAPTFVRTGPRFSFTEHDESQTAFRITFPGVPEQHPDFPALQLLRRVLDDGLSSRLPHEVVEKRGLAYSVQASLEAYHDVGLFEIEGACAPERTAEVVSVSLEVLGRLAAEGPTDAELVRAKRRHRIFHDFAQDAPGELAAWFGSTELYRPPETFEERTRQMDEVTHQQLIEVAARHLTGDNLHVVAVGPKRGVKDLEKAVAAARGLAPR
ncbi:MAG TPA: pitrilysin family protein [Myxococcaceae bacterium]|nr:pitrilysin family protein [Myxococcaceae bacterium]